MKDKWHFLKKTHFSKYCLKSFVNYLKHVSLIKVYLLKNSIFQFFSFLKINFTEKIAVAVRNRLENRIKNRLAINNFLKSLEYRQRNINTVVNNYEELFLLDMMMKVLKMQ